jgi:hypothetical protein
MLSNTIRTQTLTPLLVYLEFHPGHQRQASQPLFGKSDRKYRRSGMPAKVLEKHYFSDDVNVYYE